MQCRVSIKGSHNLGRRSPGLISLDSDFSVPFLSPCVLDSFNKRQPFPTIQAYNPRIPFKECKRRNSPVPKGGRSRWITTAASSRRGSTEILTHESLLNLYCVHDQVEHNQRYQNDLLSGALRERSLSIKDGKCVYQRLSKQGDEDHKYFHHFSNRARLHVRPSPPASLALFLESRSRPHAFVESLKKLDIGSKRWDVTLPGILLRYLFMTKDSQPFLPSPLAVSTLQRYGFSMEDVKLWAYIVTAPTDEEAARRYLSNTSVMPTFLLLEILRRSRLSVESLRSLLIKSWDVPFDLGILGHRNSIDFEAVDENEAIQSSPENQRPSIGHKCTARSVQDNTFTVLITRLLRHARQVWPAAVISIAHLTVKYCRKISRNRAPNQVELTSKLHARLCKIYNLVLHRLSLPASLDPLISATYSWCAQRVILETISLFQPSLELDKRSYRAVSRVLLASRKSPREEKFTQFIKRSWPPWRKELDGMDAERSPNEDISRVIAALSLMQQAGYAQESDDKAIGILGGREHDGTPTIQTRFLKRERSVWIRRAKINWTSKTKDSKDQWTARITATRDVQEAWAAFLEFNASQQQKPSLSMYHAMYEKLLFNTKLHDPRVAEIVAPGDGREVVPIQDDNISEAEKLRTQPPTLDELYAQMIRDNIRPAGRCLALLIERANSFMRVAKYLSDSGIGRAAMNSLLLTDRPLVEAILERIPNNIFAAYIKFLSRVSRLPSRNPIKSTVFRSDQFYGIKSNALQHAFRLMKCRQTSDGHAWTNLVQAIANRGFVLDDRVSDDENSIMSWRLLEAVLQDSYKAGARLDPSGFQYICYGLEKVLHCSAVALENEATLVKRGHNIIKEAFSELARRGSHEERYKLPGLLFGFAGPNLHAYIRALGLLQDVGEIQAVIKWMVAFQDELGMRAAPRRNGMVTLRRALVATRAFTDHDGVDKNIIDDLRDQISKLDGWGGWPTDSELEAYLRHGTQR